MPTTPRSPKKSASKQSTPKPAVTPKAKAPGASASDKLRKQASAEIQQRIDRLEGRAPEAAPPDAPAVAPSKRPQKSKLARPAKAAAPRKDKRLSALGAAAQVLAGSKQPMNVKDLMSQIEAKGLWTSPGGKTPAATLAAAVMREIKDKAQASRFRKAGRGLFTASKATAAR